MSWGRANWVGLTRAGVAPARPLGHRLLRPACLLFHHLAVVARRAPSGSTRPGDRTLLNRFVRPGPSPEGKPCAHRAAPSRRLESNQPCTRMKGVDPPGSAARNSGPGVGRGANRPGEADAVRVAGRFGPSRRSRSERSERLRRRRRLIASAASNSGPGSRTRQVRPMKPDRRPRLHREHPRQESNLRPPASETGALPLGFGDRATKEGLEPPTSRFVAGCSSDRAAWSRALPEGLEPSPTGLEHRVPSARRRSKEPCELEP